MNNNINCKPSLTLHLPKNLLTYLTVSILVLMVCLTASAQDQPKEQTYTKPSWRFGLAGGANFNFYEGSTFKLNENFTPPATFHKGFGIGLFLAPVIEYHKQDSRFGFMFQAGYDSRKGDFDQVKTACDCPADLSANLNYITIEPSIRFAPFRSNFYLYGGPRLAINLDKGFVYQQDINPAFPEQVKGADVKGDFSNTNKNIISMQIGMGYDIELSSRKNPTQFMLSPFVAFHPYFGQDPRSIESWNLTTIRAGVALKFGRGTLVETKVEAAVLPTQTAIFTVIAPKNVPKERIVKETFPLRNYVFFDLESTEIPSRYVMLKKEEVKDFKEDQLQAYNSQKLDGRSKRQMMVYYNILNILGDRMQKYPASTITLVGSSEKGNADGLKMSESIKKYLVEVFLINPSRIKTEGRGKPEVPSEQPGGKLELVALREGDRRVSIESSSSELLMEFKNTADLPLKPVEIIALQEAPLDSYIVFNNDGASVLYTSWSMQIKDAKGTIQSFGPYTEDKVSIPSKTILGTNLQGEYKVKMIGVTKANVLVEKEVPIHMELWTPTQTEEAMRFSIIYEFNESKAKDMYQKYIAETIIPKIPTNGKVMIHGYTDSIGDAEYNQKLSEARTADVKAIFDTELARLNRKDVTFEVQSFGENETLSPFENKHPEERFYNRTVVIDIIPAK